MEIEIQNIINTLKVDASLSLIAQKALVVIEHQSSIIAQQAEEIDSHKKDIGYRQEEIKRQMGYNLEKSRENVKLEKDIARIKHIAGLLAARIDISDEVFDALSMEEDYEFYSSKARKGESPC